MTADKAQPQVTKGKVQPPAQGEIKALARLLRLQRDAWSVKGASRSQWAAAACLNRAADLLQLQAAEIGDLIEEASRWRNTPTSVVVPAGILHISDFRGLENADFQQQVELPPGKHELFTAPTPPARNTP